MIYDLMGLAPLRGAPPCRAMPDMPAPGRRLRWWQVLVAIALLFGILVCCLAMWLRTTGDLDGADARARSLGLPVGLSDLGFAPADAARGTDWARLQALAGQLSAYADSTTGIGWSYRPGTEPPGELVEHHARLDQALIDESANILTRLGDEPIDANQDISPAARIEDATALRRLMRLWGERILIAPAERVAQDIETASRLIPRREPAGLLRVMVMQVLAEQWSLAVLARKSDLAGNTEAIAKRAELLATLLPPALQSAWRNDLASLRGFVGSADPSRVWSQLGREGGSFSLDAWGFAIALRAGRARTLELMQDIAAAHADPFAAAQQYKAAEAAGVAASQTSMWRPGTMLAAMTMPVAPLVIVNAHTGRLKLLVLSAELTGAAWPVDPFDPAGKPVRRVERDGQLIGAYSVSGDGIDGGGDQKLDRCWPLYGVLGTDKAADQPAAIKP